MLGCFICSNFMWLQKTWERDPIRAGHLKDEHSMHACSFPIFFFNVPTGLLQVKGPCMLYSSCRRSAWIGSLTNNFCSNVRWLQNEGPSIYAVLVHLRDPIHANYQKGVAAKVMGKGPNSCNHVNYLKDVYSMLGPFICSNLMLLQKSWVRDTIHADYLKDVYSTLGPLISSNILLLGKARVRCPIHAGHLDSEKWTTQYAWSFHIFFMAICPLRMNGTCCTHPSDELDPLLMNYIMSSGYCKWNDQCASFWLFCMVLLFPITWCYRIHAEHLKSEYTPLSFHFQ